MLIRREERRSLPYCRAIRTIRARPILASQAPNVKEMRAGGNCEGRRRIMMRASIREIASRLSNAINKCFRWRRRVTIGIEGRATIKRDMGL